MPNPNEVLGSAAPPAEEFACRRIPKPNLTVAGGRNPIPVRGKDDILDRLLADVEPIPESK